MVDYGRSNDDGAEVVLELASGQASKNRGWPRLHACVRKIVGDGKVYCVAGKLMVNTKNSKQTKRFLAAKCFDGEGVICSLDEEKYPEDLREAGVESVMEWLKEFGTAETEGFGGNLEKASDMQLVSGASKGKRAG